MKCEAFHKFFLMILTKITTLEFSVAKRACKANPELKLTSGLNEVNFPRKMRPREPKANRAGAFFRDGNLFGWKSLQGSGTV